MRAVIEFRIQNECSTAPSRFVDYRELIILHQVHTSHVHFDTMLVTLDLGVDSERGKSRSEFVGTEVSVAISYDSRNTSEIDHTPIVAYSEDG
jgi:hypothetical protein